MAFTVKPFDSYTSSYFKNPYNFGKTKANSTVSDLMTAYRQKQTEVQGKRSMWDRVSDGLMGGVYASAGFASGVVDLVQGDAGATWSTPWKQAGEGLLASNMFGEGRPDSEYTYSKVLENMGWKPESTLGKVAKGTVGFVGDVLFDPTTYLTGGVSALVKGSGRTSKVVTDLGKFSDEAPKLEYANRIASLTEKGISFERAEKFAIRKSEEVASKTNYAYMTDDVARTFVESEARKRGSSYTREVLDRDAKEFASKWNELRGIRDVNGGKAITMGVANLPFGQYIAPKMGVFGKTVQLSDGNMARALADFTKTATVYSRTRDALYGSKLGRLFSTNAGAQKLARENPGGLYDLLKFASFERGLAGDKLAKDKLIREKARDMNFTPAETSALIKALEDKTVMSKVKKTLKISETAKGAEFARNLEKARNEMMGQKTDYVAKRKELDLMKTALEKDIEGNRDILNNYVSEYRDYFAKVKLDEVKDLDEKAKVIAIISDEVKALTVKKEKLEAERGFALNKEESTIIQRIEGLEGLMKSDLAERTKQFKERGELPASTVKVDDEIKTAIDANGQERRIGEMEGMAGVGAKYDLIREISQYAFGNKDKLPVRMMDGSLEQLTKLVKSGASPSEVRDYVAMNGRQFDPHLTEVYKHVASELGYESWAKTFDEPMRKFDEILQEGKELSPFQKQKMLDLYNLKEKREHMISRLYNDMDEDQFHQTRKALANQKMLEDMRGLLETNDLNKARSEFIQDDSHLDFGSKRVLTSEETMFNDAVVRYVNHINTKNDKIAKKAGNEFEAINPEIVKAQREFDSINARLEGLSKNHPRYNEMVDAWDRAKFALEEANKLPRKVKLPGTRQSITSAQLQRSGYEEIPGSKEKIDIIVRNMGRVMKEHFPDMDYKKLSKENKAFVMRLATNSKLRKQLSQPQMKKAIADQAQLKADMNRINTIVDTVKPGHTVYFNKEDGLYKATVDKTTYTEYGTMYKVKLADGSMDEVYARDISRVGSANHLYKPDELVENSSVARHYDEESARIEESIKDANDRLMKEYANLQGTRNEWMEKKSEITRAYHESRETVRNQMVELEAKHTTMVDTIKAVDESGEFETLNKSILEIDNALANTDALEDYLRLRLNDVDVERIARAEMGNGDILAKITFDSKLDDSEKLREWFNVLRQDFDKIGYDELTIGKLSAEQFDQLAGSYLPHILTEDGKRLLESARGKKVVQGGITNDLGYGTKWNPFEQSRKLEGGVLDINERFSQLLKGKNMMSTDMSEIYIQRMMKHNELMYDDSYMQTMMKTFGTKITDGTVPEGYKAVINIGHLRASVDQIVRERMQAGKLTVNPGQTYEKMLGDTLNELGFPEDFYKNFATPMIELTPEQLARTQKLDISYAVSDVIVEKANRARKLKMAKDESRFLQVYDKFLHWTKLMQTTIMPHFHIRNKMSNWFQNYLSVGVDANTPRMQLNAIKAVRANGDTEALRSLDKIQYTNAMGQVDELGWDELYDMAIVHGVIDTGVFAKDVGAGASSKGLLGGVVNPKYDPTDTQNFIGFTKGMEVGSAVDNSDRLAQMASLIRQGKTPLEASEQVKKFLFDYSDLTGFEQSVMKRILPYYTWLRKNGKLQAQQVVDQPEKFRDSAKVLEGINGMNNQEDLLDPRYQNGFATDWVQLPQSDKAIEEGKKPLILNPFMPFMDLNQIPTQGMDSLRGLLAQTAVPIKLPIELVRNKSLFFNADITHDELTTSENTMAVMRHVALQIAPTQAADGLLQKDGEHLVRHVIFLTSGIKTVRFDEERSRGEMMYEQMYEQEGLASKFANNTVDGFKQGIESVAHAFGGKVPDRFAPTPDVSRSDMDLDKLIPQLESKIKSGQYKDSDIDKLRSYYMLEQIDQNVRHDAEAIDKKIQSIATW